MKFQEKLLMILKREKPLIDVWHYFVGNYRYYFWYGGKWSRRFGVIAAIRKKVIRLHIKEQIEWRIKIMDKECYDAGSCKMCGCETTALQMCDKPCDKPCYPDMMKRREWGYFKKGFHTHKDKNGIWYIANNNKLMFLRGGKL